MLCNPRLWAEDYFCRINGPIVACRPISLNVQTKDFARRTSHSVWGWTGKDNAKTKPLFPTDSKMAAEWYGWIVARDVFEPRTNTGSDHLARQDSRLSQILKLMVPNIDKTPSSIKLVVSRQMKKESSSLPVAVRGSKTPRA